MSFDELDIEVSDESPLTVEDYQKMYDAAEDDTRYRILTYIVQSTPARVAREDLESNSDIQNLSDVVDTLADAGLLHKRVEVTEDSDEDVEYYTATFRGKRIAEHGVDDGIEALASFDDELSHRYN